MGPEVAYRQGQATFQREPCAEPNRSSIQGGQDDERSENCVSTVEEVSGIHGDGDCDTGAGHRGERGSVQRVERGSVPAASLSIPGAVGDAVERGSESKSARRPV